MEKEPIIAELVKLLVLPGEEMFLHLLTDAERVLGGAPERPFDSGF